MTTTNYAMAKLDSATWTTVKDSRTNSSYLGHLRGVLSRHKLLFYLTTLVLLLGPAVALAQNIPPAPTSTPPPPPTTLPPPTPTATPPVAPSPSATPSPTPSPTPTPTTGLLNISTRARVLTNDKVLIGGLIISGSEPKRVIIRAVGNSLSSDGMPIVGRLQNPTLSLRDQSGSEIEFNDDWGQAPEPERTEIESSGLKPDDLQEAAILRTLAPGRYTAIVRGKDDTTGISLVEVYDLDPTGSGQLANLSTRGFVDTEDNLMIGGAIVGASGQDVVVRGLGPSLDLVPIEERLADPTLQLVNENGMIIAENDNWQSDMAQALAIEDAQLAPSDPMEAALRLTLPAGRTTALLRGKNDTPGIGLIEIYKVLP